MFCSCIVISAHKIKEIASAVFYISKMFWGYMQEHFLPPGYKKFCVALRACSGLRPCYTAQFFMQLAPSKAVAGQFASSVALRSQKSVLLCATLDATCFATNFGYSTAC